MPTLGVGFELNEKTHLVLEGGYLSYQVSETGNRSSKSLSQGTTKVTGASLAAIIKILTGNGAARIGFGSISYQYDHQLTPELIAALEFFGYANPKEELSAANGTQFIVGYDLKAGDSLNIGFELRSITVNSKVTVSANNAILGTDTADLSHQMINLRLAYSF